MNKGTSKGISPVSAEFSSVILFNKNGCVSCNHHKLSPDMKQSANFDIYFNFESIRFHLKFAHLSEVNAH